jgi:hypothetical protein
VFYFPLLSFTCLLSFLLSVNVFSWETGREFELRVRSAGCSSNCTREQQAAKKSLTANWLNGYGTTEPTNLESLPNGFRNPERPPQPSTRSINSQFTVGLSPLRQPWCYECLSLLNFSQRNALKRSCTNQGHLNLSEACHTARGKLNPARGDLQTSLKHDVL